MGGGSSFFSFLRARCPFLAWIQLASSMRPPKALFVFSFLPLRPRSFILPPRRTTSPLFFWSFSSFPRPNKDAGRAFPPRVCLPARKHASPLIQRTLLPFFLFFFFPPSFPQAACDSPLFFFLELFVCPPPPDSQALFLGKVGAVSPSLLFPWYLDFLQLTLPFLSAIHCSLEGL